MNQINTLKGSSILFLVVFIFCIVLYQNIGSYVSENGILIEPFYLIGIGSFSFLISVLLILISIVTDLLKLNIKKN